MKKFICTLAVLAVLSTVALSACSSTPTRKPAPTAAATEAAVTEAPAPETEAPAPATEAPAPATEAPAPATEAPAQTNPDKTELVNNRWNLSEVYVDGEKYQGNYYGSVVAQTGAYIEFHEDDTFKCILGVTGCEGTYTLNNGVILLHLTVKYTGKGTESCDEDKNLVWDHADTIKFDFNNVTNVFKKL